MIMLLTHVICNTEKSNENFYKKHPECKAGNNK